MLRPHVPFGAALALCLASAACAAPTNHEIVAPTPPPELEESLSLSVDALDLRHGSLRIEASMVDGSADVSMWLGPTCETREVGHGIATRTGFAWSLSRDEVARVIECDLTVRARGVDDDGNRVRKTAQLGVVAALQADDADSVRLLRQQSDGASTKMTFLGPARARRLHVAGTVIGVEADEETGPRGAFLSTFVVANDDLARSMFGRRRVTLLGEHFLATITVGSVTLDVSDPVPDVIVDTSGSDG